MRFIGLLFTICILSTSSSAGQELKRNTIYFEAGGATFFYSLNYDRLILKRDQKNIAIRFGVMYLPLFNETDRVIAGIPFGFSYLKKAKKNFLEFGLTASAISDTYVLKLPEDPDYMDTHIEDLVLMRSTRLGLRHQPANKRIFWNALFQFSLIVVDSQKDFRSPFEVSTTPLLSFGIGYSL